MVLLSVNVVIILLLFIVSIDEAMVVGGCSSIVSVEEGTVFSATIQQSKQ